MQVTAIVTKPTIAIPTVRTKPMRRTDVPSLGQFLSAASFIRFNSRIWLAFMFSSMGLGCEETQNSHKGVLMISPVWVGTMGYRTKLTFTPLERMVANSLLVTVNSRLLISILYMVSSKMVCLRKHMPRTGLVSRSGNKKGDIPFQVSPFLRI